MRFHAVLFLFVALARMSAVEPLPHGALQRLGPFRNPVFAFAPDGWSLAASDESGRVDIWDVRTGKMVRTLREKGKAVHDLEFSPNGRRLAIAETGAVRLIDSVSGTESQRLPTGGQGVALAFSRDGSRLVTIQTVAGLRSWDLGAGREAWHWDSRTPAPGRPVFSVDGRTLMWASAPDEKRTAAICVIDAATGKVERDTEFGAKPVRKTWQINAFAFSADGRRLATGDRSRFAHLWDAATGKSTHDFYAPANFDYFGITALAFSADGNWLATGTSDGTVRVWELALGEAVLTRNGPRAPVDRIQFSSNARAIAATSHESIYIWSPRPEPWSEIDFNEAEQYWRDLESAESPWGYRAVLILARRPKEAVEFVRKKYSAPPDPRWASIPRWIDDLNSPRFGTRDAAERQLAGLGRNVEPYVREALKLKQPIETRNRLERLLSNLGTQPTAEKLQQVRSIQVLELCGTPEAQALLRDYAAGGGGTLLIEPARAAVARLDARK